MIGYKPLSDFSFDDCVNHIERCKKEERIPDNDILELYSQKLLELKNEDDELFNLNKKTRKGCRFYLKHFPLEGAKLYTPLHIKEANKIILDIKKKRSCRIAWTILSIFFAAIIVCYLNYTPRPVLQNIPQELNVSQYGDTIYLSTILGTSDEEQIYIVEEKEYYGTRDDEPYYYVVRNVNDVFFHEEYENTKDGWFSTNEISLTDPYVIDMNPRIEEKSFDVIIYTYDLLFGFRINEKRQKINIHQLSGKGSYMSLYTYGTGFHELDNKRIYANQKISIDIDWAYNSFPISIPIFIKSDATLLKIIKNADWIQVERREDSKDNNYNFNITVEENLTSDYYRQGSVTFKTGNDYITLEFNEETGLAM